MEDWLKKMVSNFPLSNMRVIGFSHESRPIYVMEIDFEENSKKPIILVEAGAHAREWIGPAVALALIDRLLHSTNMNGNKTLPFSIQDVSTHNTLLPKTKKTYALSSQIESSIVSQTMSGPLRLMFLAIWLD